MDRIYICIDLKSFYASVECRERNLDPLTTNLVVADEERTDKTICLAVSPSLKKYGLPGRCRLFEVKQKVRNINFERKKNNQYKKFIKKSYNSDEIYRNKNYELDFIIAKPRMSYYMKYSTKIYSIYLKYVSPDDIHVYSIDEVFCDITNYLKLYKITPKELVSKMIKDVYDETGITATAGIGTNMYLAKVAMDIIAKHCEPNEYGLRIAYLDEKKYREELWSHKPLTDFWRVGRGYQKKLENNKIYTMGDIALKSIQDEELLYKLFGINAELLIDHAWGYEPCTMDLVKNYKPSFNCLSSGQVLHCSYDYKKTELIIREMADLLCLDLVNKKLLTKQLVLNIGYDMLNDYSDYSGDIVTDFYGRLIPKPSHGSINLNHYTSSSTIICEEIIKLYKRIVKKDLMVKRVNITFNFLENESNCINKKEYKQFDLFTDIKEFEVNRSKELIREKDETKIQNVLLNIKNKYGKNSILKGMNLEEGGTTIERNKQIGGHHM